MQEDDKKHTRLIAKVLREIVGRQSFTDYHEVKDALRARLRVLRIRYQQYEFDDAITLVNYEDPIVAQPSVTRPCPPLKEVRPILRAEATRLWRDILARLGRATP